MHYVRRWQGEQSARQDRRSPAPNIDELNDAIPRTEWEIGISGEPRPPWEHALTLYLFNLDTAERTTYVTSTKGGSDGIASSRIRSFGCGACAASTCVRRSRLGLGAVQDRVRDAQSADFRIMGSLDLSGEPGGMRAEPVAPKQLPSVAAPSLAEEMNSEDPWGA